jgi:pyruvate-ferredoxin/flavodoxin oxidoreductase
MVELAEDRLRLWEQLKEMAGLKATDDARSIVEGELEEEFEKKAAALRAEYEVKLSDLKAVYPQIVARRLAEGLLRAGDGNLTVADLLTKAESTPGLPPLTMDVSGLDIGVAPAGDGGVAVVDAPSAPAPAVVEEEEGLAMEPYIETARCTTCNECTNLNKKLFAYNDKKQAYIKDAKAGTFREIVTAAERCPVKIIHPGTPLNPKEKDLEKWLKRAEPFN